MSSSSSACSIATKNKSHRERWRVNKRNPASWLALVLAPQWLKRSLYRQSQYCTPMALPVRWHEPAGSFCCQSNTELSVHMALTDSVVSSSLRVSMHTHTHTQTLTLPLQALFTPFTKYTRAHFTSHLPTFYLNTPFTHLYWLWSELQAWCQMCYITHHAVNSAFTSIDDSAAVVEDYSALVQSRNRVEEVESAQIPLKVSVKDHDK